MKDKETPPIIFRYEERIAELKKENEQLKIKYSAKCARYDIAQNEIGSLKVEIEQLRKERFQVMWKFKMYADYVKFRNPLLHNRISSELGSDVEGYQTEVEQLKRINTLLEDAAKDISQINSKRSKEPRLGTALKALKQIEEIRSETKFCKNTDNQILNSVKIQTI